MADKRQAIYTAVKTRFATITTANGYQTGIGSKVKEWQLTPLETADLDCLILNDPVESGEDEDKNSATFTRYLEFEAKAVLSESSASPTKARQAQDDLIKCIGVDEKWGGLARRTLMGDCELVVDKEGNRFGGIDFKFRVEFGRRRWTP